MTVRRTLLRLALAACDRGDACGARPLVAAVLEMPDEPEGTSDTAHAESYARFAVRVGASARTVRAMVRDGRIPSSAIIGEGRGRRVVVGLALVALRAGVTRTSGEQAGRNYVARRRLRVVNGETP